MTCPGGCGSPIEPDGLMCRPCLIRALTIERIALARCREKLAGAQRATLTELAQLVRMSKWFDATVSKESAWGRAYNDASRELEKKYAAPTEETG